MAGTGVGTLFPSPVWEGQYVLPIGAIAVAANSVTIVVGPTRCLSVFGTAFVRLSGMLVIPPVSCKMLHPSSPRHPRFASTC